MTTKPNAAAAIAAAKTDIDAMLAQLTALSADHFGVDSETAHWGHAGTVNEIRNRLRAVVAFATPGQES